MQPDPVQLIAVACLAGCWATAPQPTIAPMQPPVVIAPHPPSKPPTPQRIVVPRRVLVYTFDGHPALAATVTSEFVKAIGDVWPMHPSAADEGLMANCQAVLDDPTCIVRISRRYEADWVVWGIVRSTPPEVDAQLVRTRDAQVQSITFAIHHPTVSAEVRAAWEQLDDEAKWSK